jgi:hypothetical protein
MSFEFSIQAGIALLATYNKIDGRFVKFLRSIPKNENERFFDTYSLSNFSIISDEDIDRLLFSITKVNSRNADGQVISEYYTFEDNEVEGLTTQNYSSNEIEFFRSRYAPARPEIQVDLTPPAGNFNSSQAVVENDGMQYDSLSSLGGFVQENFIVTATTGSATELITTATEQISDVGGTISRDREVTSTGVRLTNADGTSVAPTRTVTTSGY